MMPPGDDPSGEALGFSAEPGFPAFMVTRRGGRAVDLVLTRSLGAVFGAGLVERDRTVIKLGALILGGGRLVMLAGILATVGSRPRGPIGEPEAEESSESLLIAESKMLFEKILDLKDN
jgi:hypothetical protein